MDDEFKELLEKNLEVSEKSLKILQKMRRAEIRRSIFSYLKWVIIIGLTVYSFVQLQPYLNTLLKAYQQLSPAVGSINKLFPVLPK